MTMTDPIADLLTQIRNGLMARHDVAEVPYSRMKTEVVRILDKEGYISGYKVNENKPFSTLTIRLKYESDKEPVIRVLRRISKPGRRVYAGKNEIPPVLGGLGVNILSTSKGILSGRDAQAQGVGGEILCEVY